MTGTDVKSTGVSDLIGQQVRRHIRVATFLLAAVIASNVTFSVARTTYTSEAHKTRGGSIPWVTSGTCVSGSEVP